MYEDEIVEDTDSSSSTSSPREPVVTTNHSTALATALRTVAAQRGIIATLVDERDSALEHVAALKRASTADHNTLVQLKGALARTGDAMQQVELILGINVRDESASTRRPQSASAHREDADTMRSRRLREALRPVSLIHVSAPAVPREVGEEDTEHEAALKKQLAETDACVERLSRDRERLLEVASRNGNGRDSELARELQRARDDLVSSTQQWDAKQKELSRLRTLMRFSVLKRENERLHAVVERCDELELAKQRLERDVQSMNRNGVSSEMRRLRLLEVHCRALMEAGQLNIPKHLVAMVPDHERCRESVLPVDRDEKSTTDEGRAAHQQTLERPLPAQPEPAMAPVPEAPPTTKPSERGGAHDTAPRSVPADNARDAQQADADIPLSTITARMAKYLAKKEAERDAAAAKKREDEKSRSRPQSAVAKRPGFAAAVRQMPHEAALVRQQRELEQRLGIPRQRPWTATAKPTPPATRSGSLRMRLSGM